MLVNYYMSLPSPQPNQLDSIFTALAHERRREIIKALASQPSTVGQLSAAYQVSLPAIHRHIRILEEAGLIQRKKVGRTNFVALNRTGLVASQMWLGQYHTYWGSNQETLENYLTNLSNK